MSRVDHSGPAAPAANSIVPAASAVVSDSDNRILLQRRTDNTRWSIPGGRIEIGESASAAAVRETLEETGFIVRPLYVVGVYSDPANVVQYEDGEVRQQFSVCFACELLGGEPQTSEESLDVGFFPERELSGMEISDAIRRRINDYFRGDHRAAFD